MNEILIKPVSPGPWKQELLNKMFDIDRFVKNNCMPSLYHDYRWITVIEKSFGHECYYLVCEDSNGLIGGTLPLVHLHSLFFGNFLVSMPYFNYGGVCADDLYTRNLLIEEAIRTAKRLGASHIEFRQELPWSGYKQPSQD
jgi:hypothetical protein